jgi:hypothetical protein
MSEDDDRPGIGRHGIGRRTRWFFTNWREYDGPLSTKLVLTARNRFRALRHGCCGNDGEPGC